MKPVKFKQVNITLAENQPEYQPLPVQYNDEVPEGPMTSCWELDEAELAQIAKTGRVYIKQLTFNKPLQPVHASIYNPFEAIDVPYYKDQFGNLIAMIPMQDGSFDSITAPNFGALIEVIKSKYIELGTDNLCFTKVDDPNIKKIIT